MNSDLYGEMLKDCWRDGALADVEEVLEFADGTVDRGAAKRYFEVAEASPVDYWCVTRPDIGPVCIDVGVGAGRFALDLMRLRPNIELIGLELSPGAAAIAGSRGVPTLCVDFERYTPKDPVDAILLLGNNLGLLGYGAKFRERLLKLRSWCDRGAMLYGTAGRPESLPSSVLGLVSDESPGTFLARLRYDGRVADLYEYTFLDPEQFMRDLPREAWAVRDIHSIGDRWAIALEAV